MDIPSSIGDLLKSFTGSGATPGATEQHFEQLASAVPASSIASGLAEAFRSDQTAPFAQMASQLFANGNGAQQASLLSTLASSVGPELVSKFAASNPGSPLVGLLQSGLSSITPAQAAAIKPEDVQALAEQAQKHDPSILDRVSQVYSEHPALVKTLGAVAVGIIARKIAEQHQA